MNPTAAARPNPFRAILWGGLACGLLDLTFALVYFTHWRGAQPLAILKSIAGGLLGAEAQRGGIGTAVLGVGLHFGISFVAATAFYLASRKLRFLTDQALLSGVLFGVVVYFFMNGVVLPLSAIPAAPFPPTISIRILPVLGAHMFLVGPPIALAVKHWARR
jgi:hypothetical protein